MHGLYEHRRDSLADYERAFPCVEGASGAIVALNGSMAGADIFDQPRTALTLWPRLMRSYALDAIEGPAGGPVARERALQLLQRTQDARCETFPSLALGEDVRFEGDGVTGTALVHQGKPVHITIFRMRGASAAGDRQADVARASARRWFHSRRAQ